MKEYTPGKREVTGTSIGGVIRHIQYHGGSNSEDDFAIGSSISAYIDVEMTTPDVDVEGKELLLVIGVEAERKEAYSFPLNGSITTSETSSFYDIPMGFFTAGHPKKTDDGITFTAYDRMTKLDQMFIRGSFDPSQYSSTAPSVVPIEYLSDLIQEETGVSIDITAIDTVLNLWHWEAGGNGFSPYTLHNYLTDDHTGMSWREVVSAIAARCGSFALINRFGNLVFKRYSEPEEAITITPLRYWDYFEHNDYETVINSIVIPCTADDESSETYYRNGSGSHVLYAPIISEANHPLGDPWPELGADSIGDYIWENIDGFTYTAGSISFLGNPMLDPWDIVFVEDRDGNTYRLPVMKISHDFDGGLITEIEATALADFEQEYSSVTPSSTADDRTAAALTAIQTKLNNHLSDYDNPHKVTISQLGVREMTAAEVDTLTPI